MIFPSDGIACEHAAHGIFERDLFKHGHGQMRATEVRDNRLCGREKALEIESSQRRSVRERRP